MRIIERVNGRADSSISRIVDSSAANNGIHDRWQMKKFHSGEWPSGETCQQWKIYKAVSHQQLAPHLDSSLSVS